MHRRFILLILLSSWVLSGQAQNYVVNSANDVDDGMCDGVHCSLREAIKAAEADGLPSTITFNIPSAGPHLINPTGPFPNITQPDLSIIGESQPGGPGSLVIEFNYRQFFGMPFWQILASRFSISGFEIRKFLFENPGETIFQFGTPVIPAQNCQIRNCAIYEDNSFIPGLTKQLITVSNASGLIISNNKFGIDFAVSNIFKMEGYLAIEATQAGNFVTIDSNIFVNKIKMIDVNGGDVHISKNIFGAVDTNKANNLLLPGFAIVSTNNSKLDVIDNFFFGITNAAISLAGSNSIQLISKNRFYNNNIDLISAGGNGNPVLVNDNIARDGKYFVYSQDNLDFYIERNNINNYDTVIYNLNEPGSKKIRYIDNRMTCINDKVVVMDPTKFPAHPVPIILTVNRNQITGSGLPNDSVVVYSNNRLLCPNAVCQGGVELGKTRCDAAGNWVLNVAYPNRTNISAYQFESNPVTQPNIYSEFSNCYQCPGQVKINFTPSLCSGQTVLYRGKVYSQANPKDSTFVRGDGVSVCDSVILVNVSFTPNYRINLTPNLCVGDTLRFGSVEIHKFHLVDSIVTKTAAGCDSVVTIVATEVGAATFAQAICDNASVTIGGTRFDKNNTSGIATITGAAVGGCDSVVTVNLTIKNFTESFIRLNMCPGRDTIVGGTLFNQANPLGDVTLKNGSSTGCDSLIHVNLNYPDNTGRFSATICRGDSILVINEYFSETKTNGQIVLPNGSSFGCDSILDVTINLMPNSQGNYSNTICRGDTLNLHGEQFFNGKTTGTILLANQAANGCDSMILVNISILPDAIGSFDTTLCENQTITLYGQVFSLQRPRGNLKIDNASSRMCDSFVMVNVNFVKEALGSFTPSICRKGQVQVGNQVFTASNPTGQVRLPGASVAGCDSLVDVAVTIIPSIGINFTENALKCNVINTGSLTLNSITGGTGNYQISIDNGGLINYTPGQTIPNLSQGNHSIRIVDQTACDTVYNFNIANSQNLFLQLPNDTVIKLGNVVNITTQLNFNPTSILWDPDLYLSCNNCLNPQSIPDQTITYMLTAQDSNGCVIKDAITITVLVDEADIFVPTAFSPNGDNINDFFHPVFKFPEKTSILVFRIFDRWGNMVYERTNGLPGDPFGWDGTFNKEKMNPGVYTFAIQYAGEDKLGKWKTGDVTLIR